MNKAKQSTSAAKGPSKGASPSSAVKKAPPKQPQQSVSQSVGRQLHHPTADDILSLRRVEKLARLKIVFKGAVSKAQADALKRLFSEGLPCLEQLQISCEGDANEDYLSGASELGNAFLGALELIAPQLRILQLKDLSYSYSDDVCGLIRACSEKLEHLDLPSSRSSVSDPELFRDLELLAHHLKSLTIPDLSSEHARDLAKSLKQFEKLERLDLPASDAGAHELVFEALQGKPITRLSGIFSLNNKSGRILASFLPNLLNDKIQFHCHFDSLEIWDLLIDGMIRMKNLKSVDIKGGKDFAFGEDAIARLLLARPDLRTLSFSRRVISIFRPKDPISSKFQNLALAIRKSRLQVLEFNNVWLTFDGACDLAVAAIQSGVKQLSILYNHMNYESQERTCVLDEGFAKVIADALPGNVTLQLLNLTGNPLRCEGIDMIAASLWRTHIQILVLSRVTGSKDSCVDDQAVENLYKAAKAGWLVSIELGQHEKKLADVCSANRERQKVAIRTTCAFLAIRKFRSTSLNVIPKGVELLIAKQMYAIRGRWK